MVMDTFPCMALKIKYIIPEGLTPGTIRGRFDILNGMNDFVYTTPAQDVAALINLIEQLIDNRGAADETTVYLHAIPDTRRGNDYGVAETIAALESKYSLNRGRLETF